MKEEDYYISSQVNFKIMFLLTFKENNNYLELLSINNKNMKMVII
jgi:hypothetical protein